jgi:hypothetical protein
VTKRPSFEKSLPWQKLRRKRTWLPAGFYLRSGALKNSLPCSFAYAGNFYPLLRCWMMLARLHAKFGQGEIVIEPEEAAQNEITSITKSGPGSPITTAIIFNRKM